MKTLLDHRKHLVLLLSVALALSAGVGAAAGAGSNPATAAQAASTGKSDATAFATEQAQFEKDYAAELSKPDGWLSVIGLHWVAPGKQTVGGGAGNSITLAIAPDKLGTVEQRGDTLYFTPAKGAVIAVAGKPLAGEIALEPEGHGGGTQLVYDGGKGKITAIKRADKLALRVRHADAPTRLHFAGVDFFPANQAWVVKAQFHANPPGTTLPIVNLIGNVNDTPNPGYVEFDKDGKTWRLQALGDPARSLNLMFQDGTSGKATYAVARYLHTGPVAADGTVAIDFNRATNPPCAFTSYATCPLPPPENHFAQKDDKGNVARLAVKAGEKKYRGHEEKPAAGG